MRLKANKFEKVVSLLREVEQSEDWILMDRDFIYGGGGEQDVDYVAQYYNEKTKRAIEFMINDFTKNAYLKKIKIKDLNVDEPIISRKK